MVYIVYHIYLSSARFRYVIYSLRQPCGLAGLDHKADVTRLFLDRVEFAVESVVQFDVTTPGEERPKVVERLEAVEVAEDFALETQSLVGVVHFEKAVVTVNVRVEIPRAFDTHRVGLNVIFQNLPAILALVATVDIYSPDGISYFSAFVLCHVPASLMYYLLYIL